MAPDELLDFIKEAKERYIERTGFLYSPSARFSFITKDVRPEFLWVNTDGILSFSQIGFWRTYTIELRYITIAGNLETSIDNNRLLLDAYSTLHGIMLTEIVPNLKCEDFTMQFSPFYSEGAGILSGAKVVFSPKLLVACNEPDYFLLPDGGSLLLPD